MNDPELTKDILALYSDLVKIGIPSILALVTGILSFFLAKKGHEKDVHIEHLRADLSREKDRNTKISQLVQDISIDVSLLHRASIEYGSLLSAMFDTIKLGEQFPEKNRTELSRLYSELTNTVHIGVSVKTKVHLLGNKEVINAFDAFWQLTAEFSYKYSPHDDHTATDVQKIMLQMKQRHEKILDLLSIVYLN